MLKRKNYRLAACTTRNIVPVFCVTTSKAGGLHCEHKRHIHKVLFAAYEDYLDRVSEVDWLKDARVASMLRQNLYHHGGGKYHLHAYYLLDADTCGWLP